MSIFGENTAFFSIRFAYGKWHLSKQNLPQDNNSNENQSNNVDGFAPKKILFQVIRANEGNE